LLQAITKLDDRGAVFQGYCLALSDYAVAPRYPGWEDFVGTVDIAGVLSSASAVLDHVGLWLDLKDKSNE
jgi:hypothetical protein